MSGIIGGSNARSDRRGRAQSGGVLVSRVRRKLDDGRTRALLHTIRGVGYVLTDREAHHAA